MKTDEWLKWTAIGIGAYVLYRLFNQIPKVTAPVAQGMADFWVWLTSAPRMSVTGDVIIEGQNVGALANFDLKTDAQGEVYIRTSDGTVWKIGQSDANGNWPAIRPSAVDFGVMNPGSWDD